MTPTQAPIQTKSGTGISFRNKITSPNSSFEQRNKSNESLKGGKYVELNKLNKKIDSHESDADSSLNFDDLEGVERVSDVSGSSLALTEEENENDGNGDINNNHNNDHHDHDDHEHDNGDLAMQSIPQSKSNESIVTVSSYHNISINNNKIVIIIINNYYYL